MYPSGIRYLIQSSTPRGSNAPGREQQGGEETDADESKCGQSRPAPQIACMEVDHGSTNRPASRWWMVAVRFRNNSGSCVEINTSVL
ncbi:MAG: hypothetical protein MZU97_01345 [Bacillus subtilis]|nr:hypothetical protein [Bacillus subtilis]